MSITVYKKLAHEYSQKTKQFRKAKLNIWVRDKNCRVIKRTGHLHIYNCLGEEVFTGWVIKDGHAEVEIPPGCYIVRAGMRGGNIYSDRAIAIVRCEDSACINLILPKFCRKRGSRTCRRN
jgi:hypothetical protein